ncbi:MAG: alpha/beta fold hydrolase [Cryomorphaceae bacterium]
MKKVAIRIIQVILILYIVFCGLFYGFQEKLIFAPEKLNKDYQFSFEQSFEEVTINASDGISINGLLFKADSSKGLLFYLHGNAGSLSSWGNVAKAYTDLNYDVFILDYRGYGKSEGSISSQNQLYQDIQRAYDVLRKEYAEENTIVLGYSIGSGPAAYLASTNHPKLLILQAPYFNLTDMANLLYPIAPTFLLKYKFATNEYIQDCEMPVVILHGDQDAVISYESSLMLKENFKPQDTLITLKGLGHNAITYTDVYQTEIAKLLEE